MRRPARAVKSSFQLKSVTIFGFVLETAGCPAVCEYCFPKTIDGGGGGCN
jgi:hypothetical protein